MNMAGEVRSPVKRRFFKRPSWASKISDAAAADENEGAAAGEVQVPVQPAEVEFSRSETVLEQLRLEQAERAQARANKERDKEASAAARKVKRRKLSDDAVEHEQSIATEAKATVQRDAVPVTVTPSIEDAVVIDIDDDSSDDIQVQPITSPSPTKPPAADDEVRYFSDEDLSDYTREERRLRHAKGKQRDVPTTADRGPIVKLFVTSTIPGTTPLIVQRRIRQRLKEVRLAWCERQGFDADATKQVFLTWRRRRLFDLSTCESLGIRVDATGAVSFKESRGGRSSREDDVQVHMEAWTADLFEQVKREMEGAKASKARVDDDESEEEKLVEPVQSTPGMRVVLKAKGYDDFKLVVKPTTLFKQIVSAFRSQRAVPEDKTVFLMFDGERLEAETDVQNSEIGDLDYIEVHIR